MRYFKEIALWKIILLNVVIGAFMSVPLLYGLLLLCGLFGRPQDTDEKIIGIFILITILAVIFISISYYGHFQIKKYL